MSNLITIDKESSPHSQRAKIFNGAYTLMLEQMIEMATAEGSAFVSYQQNRWVATWAFYGQEPTIVIKSTSPFNAVSQLYAEWKGA